MAVGGIRDNSQIVRIWLRAFLAMEIQKVLCENATVESCQSCDGSKQHILNWLVLSIMLFFVVLLLVLMVFLCYKLWPRSQAEGAEATNAQMKRTQRRLPSVYQQATSRSRTGN